jgi:hypothetical protein
MPKHGDMYPADGTVVKNAERVIGDESSSRAGPMEKVGGNRGRPLIGVSHVMMPYPHCHTELYLPKDTRTVFVRCLQSLALLGRESDAVTWRPVGLTDLGRHFGRGSGKGLHTTRWQGM